MKTIKFRAWDVDKKKMIYDIQDEHDYHVGGELNFAAYLDCEDFAVMQYTGIKDKNGKEIYEGDILKASWGSKEDGDYEEGTGKVVYENGCFSIHGNYPMPLFKWAMKSRIEIIGNIHENPIK